MDKWEIFTEQDNIRLNNFKPITRPVKNPNREGLKIFNSLTNNFIRTYPKKCCNDEQKFIYLSGLFLTDKIEEPMFVEFAEVLKFQHPKWENKEKDKIREILNQKIMRELKWEF